jgi:hypothetical protein
MIREVRLTRAIDKDDRDVKSIERSAQGEGRPSIRRCQFQLCRHVMQQGGLAHIRGAGKVAAWQGSGRRGLEQGPANLAALRPGNALRIAGVERGSCPDGKLAITRAAGEEDWMLAAYEPPHDI